MLPIFLQGDSLQMSPPDLCMCLSLPLSPFLVFYCCFVLVPLCFLTEFLTFSLQLFFIAIFSPLLQSLSRFIGVIIIIITDDVVVYILLS